MSLPVTNRLLESLPASEQSALKPHLEAVSMPLNFVLYEADISPRYVYFMTSGFASVVTTMTHGAAVEVGMIGREGVPGIVFLLGEQVGLSRCFMQLEGTALRIPFRQLREEFGHLPGLQRRILQHVQYEMLGLSQLSACNRVHEVEERLARWLLMVADRIGDLDLHITQEFLGQMLGARRSTVTVTAGVLQRSGLIRYQRGRVQILDRASLENVACECYRLAHRLLQNLYQP